MDKTFDSLKKGDKLFIVDLLEKETFIYIVNDKPFNNGRSLAIPVEGTDDIEIEYSDRNLASVEYGDADVFLSVDEDEFNTKSKAL